jgi:hypothetical protein
MRNNWIAAAGLLSLGLTAIHVVAGGHDVHLPILDSSLSPTLKGFVSVVWHGVTAMLAICTGMLFVAAQDGANRSLLTRLVIGQYMAFVALFLFYGVVRFGSILIMPPWIGFGLISVVAGIGLWADARISKTAP